MFAGRFETHDPVAKCKCASLQLSFMFVMAFIQSDFSRLPHNGRCFIAVTHWATVYYVVLVKNCGRSL